MAITYTWKIDMMHTQSRAGLTDAVTEIHWSKTGTDSDNISGRYPGCSKFKIENIADSGFTPLSSLTQAQVLQWIQSSLTVEDMNFIDAQIDASINHQKQPTQTKSLTVDSMPWEI